MWIGFTHFGLYSTILYAEKRTKELLGKWRKYHSIYEKKSVKDYWETWFHYSRIAEIKCHLQEGYKGQHHEKLQKIPNLE